MINGTSIVVRLSANNATNQNTGGHVMKTTAIFSLIVTMLMANVNTSIAARILSGYNKTADVATISQVEPLASFFEPDFEEMLDVHAWMMNESAFTSVEETAMIPVEDWMMETKYIHVDFTEVENWMVSVDAFEADETNFEATFESTEDWMFNLEAFTYPATSEVETMVKVEPWMVDTATFEATEITFEPVEEWMLDLESFNNNPVVETVTMIEVADWMLSVESFENGAEELMNECPFEKWMMKF